MPAPDRGRAAKREPAGGDPADRIEELGDRGRLDDEAGGTQAKRGLGVLR
jgi:hypothetical protein